MSKEAMTTQEFLLCDLLCGIHENIVSETEVRPLVKALAHRIMDEHKEDPYEWWRFEPGSEDVEQPESPLFQIRTTPDEDGRLWVSLFLNQADTGDSPMLVRVVV